MRVQTSSTIDRDYPIITRSILFFKFRILEEEETKDARSDRRRERLFFFLFNLVTRKRLFVFGPSPSPE